MRRPRSRRCCSTRSPTCCSRARPGGAPCPGGSTRGWPSRRNAPSASRTDRGWRGPRIGHREIPLSDLERLFTGGPAATRRAYAVAGALVQDLLDRHGEASAGRILARLGRGRPFPRAFEEATGEPLDAAVDRFWRRPVWVRWVAFAGRPFYQWMVITALALCAIYAHRRRRAEQRRRWAEEEERELAEDLLRRLRGADPRAPRQRLRRALRMTRSGMPAGSMWFSGL